VTQDTTPFEPDVPISSNEPGAGQPVDEPDIKKLGEALRQRIEIRSLAVTGLFVLAAFYTLYFARAFLLPIVLAVLRDFLLSPIIRALKRARIPEPLGAAFVIVEEVIPNVLNRDLHSDLFRDRNGLADVGQCPLEDFGLRSILAVTGNEQHRIATDRGGCSQALDRALQRGGANRVGGSIGSATLAMGRPE
jgi:hypothetical protein